MSDPIEQFRSTIVAAAEQGRALRIRGGGTKDFYGLRLDGDILDTRIYSGIVEYEPTELVFTARAGTPLNEVQSALAENGQMLAFEPPHFGSGATFGGCIAAGFSGPRRAYQGAARDFVLGVRVLNSAGEDLRFGGQVMKNVAGYDLSRLLTGSFGTLALLLEISVKVLPIPETEQTLRFEMDEAEALDAMNRYAGQPVPLSGSCFVENSLYLRLSGAASAVAAARKQLGGELMEGAPFWESVREHTHPFFSGEEQLWRLSIKSTQAPLELGPNLLEWNGSLRWVKGGSDLARMDDAARNSGGSAIAFRHGGERGPIQRLQPGLMSMQRKIKQAIDPAGVFGPHRMDENF